METTSWECPCPTPPAPGWRSHACGAFTATSYCKGLLVSIQGTTWALSIHTRTHLSGEAPSRVRGTGCWHWGGIPSSCVTGWAVPQGFDPGVDGESVGGASRNRFGWGWKLAGLFSALDKLEQLEYMNIFLTFFNFASRIIILRFKRDIVDIGKGTSLFSMTNIRNWWEPEAPGNF